MSAEIIQFVPKANPNRDAPLCNAPDASSVLDYTGALFHVGPQTRDIDISGRMDVFPYVAPDGDCA